VPPLLLAAICSTMCAASTCTLTLVDGDIWRSRSNTSSGPHRCWAITMPLARWITGMVAILACSRAYAESCKISRRDRPLWMGDGPPGRERWSVQTAA